MGWNAVIYYKQERIKNGRDTKPYNRGKKCRVGGISLRQDHRQVVSLGRLHGRTDPDDPERGKKARHDHFLCDQGASAYTYASIDDMLQKAKDAGEDPFLIFLDNVEDPHNLGAIIRTANLAGAHGVVIPKRRAVGLTATVAKASAGAINYTPVAKVTNLSQTIETLKQEGMWFVCADMGGSTMYDLNLTGPIGLVMGNEGSGVSDLVKKHCDFVASIPMKGDIDSLNVSVATGVLTYEIVRQRLLKK